MSRKVVVSRLWKKRGIQQYFSLLQLSKEFWDFEIEANILIDDWSFEDDWTKEIDKLSTPHREGFPMTINFYTMDDLSEWYIKNNLLTKDEFYGLRNFIHIYHVLLYYYLMQEKGIEYLITYDDDVYFNDKIGMELSEIDGLVLNNRSFVIDETKCPISDKGMFYKLSEYFGYDISKEYYKNNYNGVGVNAGFMGINLNSVFYPFIGDIKSLLNLFEFKDDKTFMSDVEKRLYDTQEQSFLSIMTHCYSPESVFRLGPDLGYFFDSPIQESLNKSKIIHFTGERKFDPMFRKVITDFLRKNGFNNITTGWFYY